MSSIVPVVEGAAEVESVPVLLRRVLADLGEYRVQVARPFRVKRNRAVKDGELERALQVALRDRDDPGAVLVLLDADDDCPAELGPLLLERCESALGIPVSVVLANKELEAWFLGAKESLRDIRGIGALAAAPRRPEEIRGAKERLSRNMAGRRYLSVDDQPALAERMDITLAKERCPSFERFLREVSRLVAELNA